MEPTDLLKVNILQLYINRLILKAELVLNRIYVSQGALINEELGVWDSEGGLTYTANKNLFVEDRDGSRVQVISQCPK
jgi:hypothetical protein